MTPEAVSQGSQFAPEIVAAARRILAGGHKRQRSRPTPEAGLDVISSARYRRSHEPEDDPIADVPSFRTSAAPTRRHVKKNSDLAERLRAAVRRSGLTRNQVAKRTGLSYAIVHGFMAGTQDIRLSTASEIAALVGVGFYEGKDDAQG